MHPDVVAAMAAIAARGGNPASIHQLGQAVRRAIEAAASAVAEVAGRPGADVVWLDHLTTCRHVVEQLTEQDFVYVVVGHHDSDRGMRDAHVNRSALPPLPLLHAAPQQTIVALSSVALGGPPGLSALVGSGVAQPPGTLPRELVVGMGVAASRLAKCV